MRTETSSQFRNLNFFPLSMSKIGIDMKCLCANYWIHRVVTRETQNYYCNHNDVSNAFCSWDVCSVVYKAPLYSLVCLKICNIRNDSTWRVAENFCMSRAMPAIPFCLCSGRISRRLADTLICKRVNRGPVCLVHAVNCELAALSSVLNSLLNDYINGSDILHEVERIAGN